MRSGFDSSITIGTREVKYNFKKAKVKNKPILFILHGHGHHDKPASFRSDDWNIVCPLDCYGVEGKGTWYLGELGDFFWISAMRLIIDEVRKECGDGRLYFWGSSMGGYGALLHGHLNNAAAVYANIPQTFLLGSRYSDGGASRYFDGILARDSLYNDLKNIFLESTETLIFLCFNQLERDKYFSEQGLSFISHLESINQKMYVEVRPLSTHGVNHKIWETVELFKSYDSTIDPDSWLLKVDAHREGSSVVARSVINEKHFDNGVDYAFYLMVNGVRVDVRWYTDDPCATLIIPDDLSCESIRVQGYVRDKNDEKRKFLEIARIKL